jgi:hypothetical protein
VVDEEHGRLRAAPAGAVRVEDAQSYWAEAIDVAGGAATQAADVAVLEATEQAVANEAGKDATGGARPGLLTRVSEEVELLKLSLIEEAVLLEALEDRAVPFTKGVTQTFDAEAAGAARGTHDDLHER